MIILWGNSVYPTVTYKTWHKIKQPVYSLGYTKFIHEQDGLVLSDTGLVIDDTNVKLPTLAARRMHTPFKDRLYKLKHWMEGLQDVIHYGNTYPTELFIDATGYIFDYEPTENAQLIYYKIDKVEPRDDYCLIWCKELPTPMKVYRPPKHLYVGVLHLQKYPWLIYGYAEEGKKPSRRRV
jgi:hypothetical protein